MTVRPMLQSSRVHQVTDFLLFTAGLVAAIVSSIYRSLADVLPAPAWMGAGAVGLALVLYSRLRSRIEDVEMTLVQLDAKLDTILGRLARPREDRARREADDRSSS